MRTAFSRLLQSAILCSTAATAAAAPFRLALVELLHPRDQLLRSGHRGKASQASFPTALKSRAGATRTSTAR